MIIHPEILQFADIERFPCIRQKQQGEFSARRQPFGRTALDLVPKSFYGLASFFGAEPRVTPTAIGSMAESSTSSEVPNGSETVELGHGCPTPCGTISNDGSYAPRLAG